jgi:CSLREA domain-containing protein
MRTFLAIVFGTLTGLLPSTPALSATFTVDTTSDSAALTGCTAAPADCSLRGAIARANAVVDADVIAFDIPMSDAGCSAATGVCRIRVGADFSVNHPTLIDGYTQPGAAPNTIPAPGANDAQLKIEITNAAGFNSFRLFEGQGALTLRGLAMFLPSGGMISGARPSFVLQGNWFGVTAAGTTPDYAGNGHVLNLGVCVASEVLVGGPDPADRNVIAGSGRDVDGLPGGGSATVCAASGTLSVQGNLIGLAPDGLTPLPLRDPFQLRTTSIVPTPAIDFVDNRLVRPVRNFSGGFGGGLRFTVSNVMDQTARIQRNVFGLAVDGTRIGVERDHIFFDAGSAANAHRVLIGGLGVDEGNVFAAGTAQAGNSPSLGSVALIQNGMLLSRVEIVGNTMLGNDGIGLDFPHPTVGGGVAIGRTANDAGDADTGPNRMQNFPEISAFAVNGNQFSVSYLVDSATANSAYPLRVDFYKALGDEGEVLLASDDYLAADAQTQKPVTLDLPAGVSLSADDVIVAVATDAEGRSSEFGFHLVDSLAILSDGPDPSILGEPYTVRVRVTAAAGVPFRPNGSVRISDGRGNACLAPLSAAATAQASEGECTLIGTGSVATITLTASYSTLTSAFARADATAVPNATTAHTLKAPIVVDTTSVLTTLSACTSAPGDCSLPGAVLRAQNASLSPGEDRIGFHIPASDPGCDTAGVCKITLATTLSPFSSAAGVVESLTIDGYTQPGASANTLPLGQGSNAQPKIVISGAGMLTETEITVRGLVFHSPLAIGKLGSLCCGTPTGSGRYEVMGNFFGLEADGTTPIANPPGILLSDSTSNGNIDGVRFGSANPADMNVIGSGETGRAQECLRLSGSNHVVHGNLIGTDRSGLVARGCNSGILMVGPRGIEIGGPDPGQRNVISGHVSRAIGYQSGSNTLRGARIRGNLFGVGVDGVTPLPNITTGAFAVVPLISGDTAPGTLQIGGVLPGEGNLFAYTGFGRPATPSIPPFVSAPITRNGSRWELLGNRYLENQGIAVDLPGDATVRQPNDAGDGDGDDINPRQNFPVISAVAFPAAGQVQISYRVDAAFADPPAPGQSRYPLTIEFYKAALGAGSDLIGRDSYIGSNAQQDQTVTLTLPPGVTLAADDVIVATATDSAGPNAAGQTSEFSFYELASFAFVSTTPASVPAGAPYRVRVRAVAADDLFRPNGVATIIDGRGGRCEAPLLPVAAARTSEGECELVTSGAIGNVGLSIGYSAALSSFALANGNAPGTVNANVTLTPGVQSLQLVGGSNQYATAGSPFAAALRVRAVGAGGTPIAGAQVRFTEPASGASASLSASTVLTDAQGFAEVTASANSLPGRYSVTASIGALTQPFALNNDRAAGSQCTAARSSEAVLRDDFLGAALDPSLWTAFANDGAISVADGEALVAAGAVSAFPFASARSNPIPANGSYSVRWVATYLETSASQRNHTLATTRGLPLNGGAPTGSIFHAAAGQDPADGYRVTDVIPGAGAAFTSNPPQLLRREVEYCWLEGRNELWVDGVLRAAVNRDETLLRPDALWFGNPEPGAGEHADFRLDLVEVRTLETGFATDLEILAHTPDPSPPGAAVTVTIVLNPEAGAPAAPTGSVRISANTGENCSIVLPAASCVLNFATLGVRQIQAFYPGDAIYRSSKAVFVDHTVANPPALTIADASLTEGNSGTTAMSFVVSLANATGAPVSVDFATAPGSATAPTDFIASNGTLEFVGGTTTRTIAVQIVGDSVVEPDESFTVALANASGAVIADGSATGTIRNDDEPAPPVLAIADATVQEPVSSGLTEVLARFAVTLDRASTQPVGVRVVTSSGSATAGSDFDANDFVLEFAPGQTTATVQVRVRDDALVESAETFTVALSAPQGATLGDGEATGTILDGSADATLVVNSAADPGDGVCNASECTLREAILVANGLEAVAIGFNIAGTGPHTIRPLTPLPVAGRAIHTIDGYTQPGSSANTIPITSGAVHNARIQIELDGSALGDGSVGLSLLHGMTVRGLAIHSWRSTAVIASSRVDGRPTRIVGNFIGTAADGITARGNGNGVDLRPDALIDGAIEDFVVGGDGADRNVIAASAGTPGNGVTVGPGRQPEARVRVEGNLIGLGANGEALGNRGDGLLVLQPNVDNAFNLTVKSNVIVASGASGVSLGRVLSSTNPPGRGQIRIDDNWIGLTPDGRSLPNVEVGIDIGGPVTGTQRARLVGNRIGPHAAPVRLFNQVTNPSAPQNLALIIPAELPAGGTPIDLGSPGPTPNDPGDGDNGANLLLNTPVLIGASFNDRGDRLRVSYQIDTPAVARRVAHFYRRDGDRLLYLGEDGYPGGIDTAELVLAAPIGNGTEIYALTELQATLPVSSELSALPVTLQARQALASAQPVREASGALLRYTLQLDPPPTAAVTLRYRSIGGSAVAGTDFTAVSGQVTVSPANPTATVDVPVLNDSVIEADEGLVLEVDGAGDFAIGSAFAEGTIVDDDLLPQDQGQYTPLALESLDGRNGFRIEHPRGGTGTLVDAGEFDGTAGRDLALGVTRIDGGAEGPAALHLLPNLAPPFAASVSLPGEGSAQFPRWTDEDNRISRAFPAALPLFRGAGNRGSLAVQRGSTLLLLDGVSGALPASTTLGGQSLPPNGARISALGTDRAVALGDLNGDGLEDLGLQPQSGVVSVIYGRPPGTPLPTSTSQLDGSNGFRISFGNSRFTAFAIGDLDGDGFDDLVVDEFNNFPVIERSYFVRGRANFAATFSPTLTNSVALPPEIDLARNYLSGDFDGDGHLDLAIALGNVFSDVQIRFGDGSFAGMVNSVRRVTVRQAFPGDGLGSSLAVLPDFDGDGRADLAIGIPGSDQPQTGSGQVALLYGRGNWPGTINLADPPPSTVRFLSGRLQARAGAHVAAIGDLNGDGLGELAVSAPTVGRSYVVFSSDAIFRASAEAQPQVPASGAVYESAGAPGETRLVPPVGGGSETLPVGDLDGDGRGELLVARRIDFDRSEAIALVPGSVLAGAGLTLDLAAALPAGATSFRRAAQGEVLSTRTHAVGGDFNGDGRDDLAFLAADRARVALVFGRAGGLPGFVDPFDGAAGTRQITLEASDGLRLAFLGDTDGDGFDELGVQRGGGVIDVHFGNASGTPRRSSLSAPAALQPIDLSPYARLGRIRSGGVPTDSFAIGLDDGSHAVIFGNAAGLPATLDLSALGSAGTYLRTPLGPGGGFNSAATPGLLVGTGDLDGDGIDDLAMAYAQPSADGSPARPVALLRGRSGWPAEIDVSSSDPALVQGRILLRDLDGVPLTGLAGLRDRNGDGRRELLISLADAEGHDDKTGKALLVHGFSLPAGVQTQVEIEDLVPPGRGLTLRGALPKNDGTLANGQPLGDIDGDGREDLVFGVRLRQVGSDFFPNGPRVFVLRGSVLPP